LLKFSDLIAETKPFFDAVVNNVADKAERIFVNGGVDASGGQEEYSKKALYKNPKTSPRSFPTKGKDGKSKFKNGNEHKTGYFESYGDYKKTIGRTSFVNLIEFGNFERAFRTGIKQSGNKVIHYIRTGPDNPEKKIEGILERYEGVAKTLPKEQEQYLRDLNNYLADARENAGL
jgi:hypothetical protein